MIDPNATIEEAIYAHIQTLSAVTARVSDRVYPLQLPQNPTYPAITYRLVSDRELMHITTGPGGMYWTRFQFDCYARTYTQVKRLARTLRLNLAGFTGDVGTIEICRISFLNEVDDFEPVAGVYLVPVDFEIQYK